VPRVAAIVLYALAAPRDPGLDELLGEERATALRRELALRARRWAALVAPDVAFEATTIDAASMALHGHEGPVLLVAPDVPRLDPRLAPAALADLDDGALVVIGPSGDGSPFVVALPSADHEILALAGAGFAALADDPRVGERGVGMLMSERRLVTPDDARAYAADPLGHPDVLQHLGPVLQIRGPRADR